MHITFDEELKPEKFIEHTGSLYRWSVNHGCRFFVLAHDQTAAAEKAIYKSYMRVLERHFYKLELTQ